MTYSDEDYERWLEKQKLTSPLFNVPQEQIDAMYERCVQAFNAACDKIDREQDDATLRRLLYDVFGHRTYEVPEPLDIRNSGLRPSRWT